MLKKEQKVSKQDLNKRGWDRTKLSVVKPNDFYFKRNKNKKIPKCSGFFY